MKVLLNSSHMNEHTLGFQLQTEKLEPPCTADCFSYESRHFQYNLIIDLKVREPFQSIINNEITKKNPGQNNSTQVISIKFTSKIPIT